MSAGSGAPSATRACSLAWCTRSGVGKRSPVQAAAPSRSATPPSQPRANEPREWGSCRAPTRAGRVSTAPQALRTCTHAPKLRVPSWSLRVQKCSAACGSCKTAGETAQLRSKGSRRSATVWPVLHTPRTCDENECHPHRAAKALRKLSRSGWSSAQHAAGGALHAPPSAERRTCESRRHRARVG